MNSNRPVKGVFNDFSINHCITNKTNNNLYVKCVNLLHLIPTLCHITLKVQRSLLYVQQIGLNKVIHNYMSHSFIHCINWKSAVKHLRGLTGVFFCVKLISFDSNLGC